MMAEKAAAAAQTGNQWDVKTRQEQQQQVFTSCIPSLMNIKKLTLYGISTPGDRSQQSPET